MRRAAVALALAGALTGCVAAATEGVRYADSKAMIDDNIAAAEKGDPVAQYRVGSGYCCGIGDRSGVYDSRKAVLWYCRAARQGYAPAQYRLGRIYSGDTVFGMSVARKLASRAAGAPRNDVAALMWLRVAAAGNDPDVAKDAEKAADALARDMNPTDVGAAITRLPEWRSAPCTWEEVRPKA